jgi:hypothetical protein
MTGTGFQPQIFTFDLATAGSQKIDLAAGSFRFINCEDASGALSLNGKVSAKIGQADGTAIAMRLNNALIGRTSRHVKLSWEAQTGLTATFLFSPSEAEFDMDATPPAQLVVGDLASAVSAANVAVGTSEVVAAAANASRKAVTVKSLSTNAGQIYLGATGLATTDGFELSPGEAYTFTNTTAAIYAISDTAAQAVRVISE